MARGRPNKYKTHVEPYLEEISEMALNMNEAMICKQLGVGITAWNDYKKKYPQLIEALRKGRRKLVTDLRSTLINKAKGFSYNEKKIVKEGGEIVREEIYTRMSLPDVAAINLALKNYDPDNWSNDPQLLKIKQEELELKKQQADKENW